MKHCIADRLLTALVLTVAASVCCEICTLRAAASLLFTLTFPLTVALWLVTQGPELEENDLLLLTTLAAVALSVAFGGLRAGFVTVAGLKKAVMLAMSLLYFRAVSKLPPDRAARRVVDGCLDGLSLVFLAAAPLTWQPSEDLTLHFGNPNLAGLFLCCLVMHQLCRRVETGHRRHGLLAAGLGILLVLTRSRNGLLVAAGFLLWGAVGLNWKSRRFSRPLAAAAALLPGLFALAYLLLMPQPWVQRLLAFAGGTGKPLDSRLALWQQGLGAIMGAPLFGDLFRLAEDLGQSQLHNTHLELAGFFGLPVLALVLWQLYRLLLRPRPQTRPEFAAALGFAGCVALGMGEAAMFSGGLGIYVLMGLFLWRREPDAAC